MIRTGVQITDGIQVRVNMISQQANSPGNQTGCVPGHRKHTPGQKHRQTQTQEAGFVTTIVASKYDDIAKVGKYLVGNDCHYHHVIEFTLDRWKCCH